MGLKKFIINKKIKSRLKSSDRHVCFKNMVTARTAGIIWNVNDKIAYKNIVKKLNKNKIKFRSICISNNKLNKNQKNLVTCKDFNFSGTPKNKFVQNFLDTEFDILIDISLSSSIYAQIIRSFSMAHFKIGWAPVKTDYFDMTIDISKNPESQYLIKQICHYLNIIN